MSSIFYLIIFLFGLLVGSFLNCVIYRLALQNFAEQNLEGLEKEQSFLKGRSYCPYCNHVLNWRDLVPIFSFLILKGKCRYCQKPISWQYPLVEISTAVLFIAVFNPQNFLLSAFYFLISSFLIIIFVYDLKHCIIPDKMIYPLIIISFLYHFIFNFSFLANSLLSAVLAALPFFLIVWLSKEKWMGAGDIKIAFFMGLFLGFPNILVALFSAFFIGAIIGIGLIIFGKRTLKSEIPFGPFLITGTFLALFVSGQIINWYLNFFF